MKNIIKTFLVLAVAALVIMPSISYAGEYAVIVNDSNSNSASQGDIKRMFLKQQTSWADGTSANPFDRKADSAEHKAFASKVLGMTEAELAEYWGAEKSKSGTTPPREIGSDSILTRQVSRKGGGFGVVSSAAANADGVKILFKFSD